VVAISAAVLALAIPTGASASFTLGVSSGEITDTGAKIWGRADKSGGYRAQVATDQGFNHIVKHRRLHAQNGNDLTMQADIAGLGPNKTYYYRFCRHVSKCSQVGTFETAPSPNQAKTVRFAYSGDESAAVAPGDKQPFWGGMKAFSSMAQENNDFNINLGDTIYSDPEVPGQVTALTVAQKWAKYRQNLGIQPYRTVRKSTGMYDQWDDHEFINDFSRPENGNTIYKAGKRAFRDYMPVHYNSQTGLYRTFRWGKNLELFFLDERSFRSAKADDDCINPNTGVPDNAPTAPQRIRNVFASLDPSFSWHPSKHCKNKINSPNRTYLGADQLAQFESDVAKSDATWKVVVNELGIQQYYALPYDSWAGYAYEREQLLKDLQASNVQNLVFLTTDDHAALANVVRERTFTDDVEPSNAPATPTDTPYHDFTIGPVATRPFWQQIDDTTGVNNAGKLVSQVFFKPAQPNGLGMMCAQGDQNSYAEVTASAAHLTIDYKTEDGDPVLDVDGSTPCGPYTFDAP
jgi:alkaline phosphatase D